MVATRLDTSTIVEIEEDADNHCKHLALRLFLKEWPARAICLMCNTEWIERK